MSQPPDEDPAAAQPDRKPPPLPLSYERPRLWTPIPADGMPATFSIGMALGAPTGFLALNARDSGYLNPFDLGAIAIMIATYALIAGVITASCTIRLRAAFFASHQLTSAPDRYCLLAGLFNYPALIGLAH